MLSVVNLWVLHTPDEDTALSSAVDAANTVHNLDTVGAHSGISVLEDKISESLGKIMVWVGTWWIDVPTVGINVGDTKAVTWAQNLLVYWVGVIFVICAVVAAMKIVWYSRWEPLRDLVKSGLLTLGTQGLAVSVIASLIHASDEFASWAIKKAVNGNEADIGKFFLMQGLPGVIIILLGVIGIFIGIIQIGILMVRSVLLILLTAFLPITAAASSTEWGRQWFTKAVGWIGAALAYKPVAAIVYALGLMYMQEMPAETEFNRFALAVTGDFMLFLTAAALPALIYFLLPNVTGSHPSGGGGLGGTLAAIGMVATGAMSISRLRSHDVSDAPAGAAPSGGNLPAPNASADTTNASGASSSAGSSAGGSAGGAGSTGSTTGSGSAAGAGGGAAAGGVAGAALVAGLEAAKGATGVVENTIQAETDTGGGVA